MKDGFYPALGTPLDTEGKLVGESFNRQINSMITAGASGLLCMGSMGNMVSVRDQEYPDIAEACVEAAAGKIPVMVGVMDCSAARVMDRIYSLGDLPVDGVVATPPFYYKSTTEQIIEFYKILARESYYPVYIYDLPVVTQSPVDEIALTELMSEENIAGIKTANFDMLMKLKAGNKIKDGFQVLFSGLDIFDKAQREGINKNLDGMFTCTPVNTKLMYECAEKRDYPGVSRHLSNIIKLRNEFVKSSVFTAYSYAMEKLGMPGIYQPDYHGRGSESVKDGIVNCMKKIGEL